jgi:hypothetical protein
MPRGIWGTLQRLSGVVQEFDTRKDALLRQMLGNPLPRRAQREDKEPKPALLALAKVALLFEQRSIVLKELHRFFAMHAKARALRAQGVQVKVKGGLLVIQGTRLGGPSTCSAQRLRKATAARTGATYARDGPRAHQTGAGKKGSWAFFFPLSQLSGDMLLYPPWFLL